MPHCHSSTLPQWHIATLARCHICTFSHVHMLKISRKSKMPRNTSPWLRLSPGRARSTRTGLTRGTCAQAHAHTIHGDGGPKSWEQRPTAQFWGFRGQDDERTTLICARTSVVKGMRLLLYRVRHDGTYRKKPKSKRHRPPVTKMAITRWMVASCRMRVLRSATRTR